MNNEKDFTRADYSGKNIWYGVREFAMGAAMNGIALHGGLKLTVVRSSYSLITYVQQSVLQH